MDEVVNDVFRALADPSRRALLDALYKRNGQTLGALCEGMAMTRQAAAQRASRPRARPGRVLPASA